MNNEWIKKWEFAGLGRKQMQMLTPRMPRQWFYFLLYYNI